MTIASVMRLSRRKRPMPLLRILKQLRYRTSPSIDLRAVIIGEGPLRAKMTSYLEAHDMDSWVSLPGRLERSDIREIFSHSDLYVAPAELESFGIAALEARAAGLPVIASRHGGVGEFISDGDEGFLTGSDDEMVYALAALATDRHTREQIAAHNRAVAPSVNWANRAGSGRGPLRGGAAAHRECRPTPTVAAGEARRRAGEPRRPLTGHRG